MCIKTKKYPNGETKIYLGNGTKGSIAAIRYYYRQGRFLQCWYELANQFCQEIAREYELSLEIVAAVVAVLSPSLRWDLNMREAEALCRAFVHGQPIPKGGGYKQNRFKAWRILETKDTSLVTGVKVRPFFECIMGSLDKFVMDRHIARLWVSLQTPGKVSYATSVHQACEADFRAFAEYVGEPVGLVQERAWQGYLKVVQNR